jgi:hypothetical protein
VRVVLGASGVWVCALRSSLQPGLRPICITLSLLISVSLPTPSPHPHPTPPHPTLPFHRVDEFIVFEPLTHPQIRDIVGLKTAALVGRLAQQRIHLALADSALDYLADKVGGGGGKGGGKMGAAGVAAAGVGAAGVGAAGVGAAGVGAAGLPSGMAAKRAMLAVEVHTYWARTPRTLPPPTWPHPNPRRALTPSTARAP